MIRYTKKQRAILNFIEEYGWITSKICSNIFYKGNKNPINQARDILNKFVKNGDLVSNLQPYCGKEKFYQFEKRQIQRHYYYLLNLYSEIYKLSSKIEYFKIEKNWCDRAKRSDGIIVISNKINDNEIEIRPYLIEIDVSHKTDKNKYIDLFKSGEVHNFFYEQFGKSIFPNVIQVNYSGKANIDSNKEFEIIGLDYNFTDLIQKLLLG